MKRLFIAACGLLFLGACAALAPDNNSDSASAGGTYNADGVFVAYCSAEPAPVIFTKEGFPIIDDQACIPEPEVLGIQVTRKTMSCPEGKLLVGNVCLPHNARPRTPTVPCDGAGDLNPFVEGVQCEAPEGCDDGDLRNQETGICYTPAECEVDLNEWEEGLQCEGPTPCDDGDLRNQETGICYTPAECEVDLNEWEEGLQCEGPTPCDDGDLRNQETGVCYTPETCEEQGLFDDGGVCVPFLQCKKNEYLDTVLNQCVKCNSGGGNGDEGAVCDPGNSGGVNNGGDSENP